MDNVCPLCPNRLRRAADIEPEAPWLCRARGRVSSVPVEHLKLPKTAPFETNSGPQSPSLNAGKDRIRIAMLMAKVASFSKCA